jgi:radical SAM protein with 4Fe4S-binding SPASM domain
LEFFYREYNYIKQIIIYNAPSFGSFLEIENETIIYQFDQNININNTVIDIAYFHVNYSRFYEAVNYNIGLNKKFHIDSFGNIYYSIKFNTKIDNILNVSMLALTQRKNIVDYWTLTKENILICNVCEYRYMCFDDSEITHIGNGNKYKRKNECKYNSYISKWEWEEGYLNLNQCGIIFTGTEYQIDIAKLASINESIYA